MPHLTPLTHHAEVASTALHACFAAIGGTRTSLSAQGPRTAIMDETTIRQEHEYTEEDGVRRRFVLVVQVGVHSEEIPNA
jgi:hypothetical protein